MDGVSAAASLVALIEISVKVVSLCAEYYAAVKHAKTDIDRFCSELKAFIKVLENLEKLARDRGSTKLLTSQSLNEDFQQCKLHLKYLQKKVDPGKSRKTISRYGIRALKWPFERKELDKDIGILERHKSTFNAALNVDQT